ncbi:nicotinamide riboside kinase 1 [Anoplophora glabripennis]|uniref:nicotinamide riboside kinase 1 n=1 Tax=Anoplophora glabripennis TaxID=217634 RepID=UPI000873544E|nr:nicotinamide riboside kinase 1 [Anoplophora glabripennis]
MSKYSKENLLLIIGISGVTCGGKTTTATKLKDLLPNTTVVSQDDYFILDLEDPRHIWIPELNHINFDVITSLDMEKMYKDILHFISINNFKRVDYTDKIVFGTNGVQCSANILNIVRNKMEEAKLNILIIEGFSVFNYKPMQDIFDLKYYFTLDKEECLNRRLKRVYDPPDCPGYFEKCAWPEHLNHLDEVKNTVKDVKYIDGKNKNPVDRILKDIQLYMQKL